MGKESSRKEYDFNRSITSFCEIESGYRMDYPKPESDDPKLVAAYEDEMRRRWNARVLEWAKDQGEYELERGHHVVPMPTILERSHDSKEMAEQHIFLVGGILMVLLAIAYIYIKMWVISSFLSVLSYTKSDVKHRFCVPFFTTLLGLETVFQLHKF